MKKRKVLIQASLIVVLLTSVLITSCKKSSTANEDIVGNWTAGTTTLAVTVGTKTLTQYFADTYGLTTDQAAVYSGVVEQTVKQNFTGTLKVNADNTYTSNFGGTAETGTWSLNNDKTKLTVTPTNDTPTTFNVVELTASKLHLHILETTTDDLNSDGTLETLNVTADLNFTK
jgi:hypothetical protein